MERPLARAWETLRRYPFLALVPIVWDLVAGGTAWLLGYRAPGAGPTIQVKFLLPSVLPSGRELLATQQVPQLGGGTVTLPGLLLVVVMAVVGALVTAGFLHLLHGAAHGQAPTWDRFATGVNRFGVRLLGWNLIVAAAVIVGAMVGLAIGPLAILLMIIAFLLALFLVLVPFLIVVEDRTIGEAVTASSSRFMEHLGDLISIALASVAMSVVVSLALSALSLRTLLVASPIWGFLGTWITLAVVAVLIPPWETIDA